MCSITTPARLPQRAPTPISHIKKTVTLKTYLDASYKKVWAAGKLNPDKGLRTHIPISIYLKSTEGKHIYAGNSFEIDGTVHHLDEQECFSGSLVKVAAMFAAFKLREEADVLRKEMEKNKEPLSKFFDKLTERVKPTGAFPKIMNAAKDPTNNIPIAPSLRDILSITSLTTRVTFTDNFRAHLRRMIIISRDCDTAECIFRLSYPYINVKLMNEGYFHPDSKNGIWLAGDYFPKGGCANETKLSKLQYITAGQEFVRIDTVNDCDKRPDVPPNCRSAQNTTSKEMARLLLNILLEDPVPGGHEMKLLLHAAQHGAPPDPPLPAIPRQDNSFLDVDTKAATDPLNTNRATGQVAKKFSIQGVKIGQGELKPDPERGSKFVRSEGLLIKWKNITRDDEKDQEADEGKDGNKDDEKFDKDLRKKFDDCKLTGDAAICWQNLNASTPNTDGLIEIINDSIDNFIHQAPVTP
jgi:hypothetical protein